MDMPPPLRKQPFFICLLFNLFALPGLGTWLAGKKALGTVQMAISAAAFAATLFPILWIGRSFADQGLFRDLQAGDSLFEATRNLEVTAWHFGAALAAVALFGANWAWSAFTAKSASPKHGSS